MSAEFNVRRQTNVEAIGFFVAAATFCTAAIMLAVFTQPRTEHASSLYRFNRAVFWAVAFGVVALLLYAAVFYRVGRDGGWWPVVATLWVTVWIVAVCVLGSAARWLYFRVLNRAKLRASS